MGGLLLLLSVTVECCRYIILFALHVSFPYYKFYFCLRLQFELEIGIANLRLQWLNQCVHIAHWTLNTVQCAHIAYKGLLVSLKHFDWIPWNSFQFDQLHSKFYIKNSDLNYGIFMRNATLYRRIFSIHSWFTLLTPVWWWMEKKNQAKKKTVFSIYFNEKCA